MSGMGVGTTESTAGSAIFEVIDYPEICDKLRKELRDAFFPEIESTTFGPRRSCRI